MCMQLPHCYCVYGQGKLVFIIIATSTALRYSTGLMWINAIIQECPLKIHVLKHKQRSMSLP